MQFVLRSIGSIDALQIADLGDFNADNMADLLWRDVTTGKYYGTLMDGLTFVETKGFGGSSDTLQIGKLADFNGDSMADIVWLNINTGAYFGTTMNGLSLVQTKGLGGSYLTIQIP